MIPFGSGERSFLKAAVIFPRWVIVVPHRGGLMWKEMPRTTKLTNRNAALMSDILNGLCSLATPGMCDVRSRRKDGQICFIDKPGEWIMILRGKSASHTQAVPLLIPLPFYWQTSAIAEPGEMAGKWVLILEVYELSPFKIAVKWNGCKSWQSNVNREFRWLEKSIRRAPSRDAQAISKTGKSERELVWTENV